MSTILEALKIASSKHDLLMRVSSSFASTTSTEYSCSFHRSLSEADLAHLNISPNDRQDVVEEVLTEISVYFGMLYHLIEIFKGHEDFADELSEYD